MRGALSRLFRPAPRRAGAERTNPAGEGQAAREGQAAVGDAASPETAAGGEAERDADRREMIQGVQELGETTVKEVMVPRTDVVFLPLDAGREEILRRIAECGHSSVPVYEGSVDSVVGLLYAKDLLRALVAGGAFEIADLLRAPYFVPESKRIDSLLAEFRRRRVHIAVAVDEYGAVSGIVSLEDIIEEIVGEIQDEFEVPREEIVRLGERAWLCDARAPIELVSRETGLALPADGYDTLGGLVFSLFGRIPERREKASLGELEFSVQDMDGHRLTSIKIVHRRPRAAEE